MRFSTVARCLVFLMVASISLPSVVEACGGGNRGGQRSERRRPRHRPQPQLTQFHFPGPPIQTVQPTSSNTPKGQDDGSGTGKP